MINFLKTNFVQSFTTKNDGSVQTLPEVIFIGRSNVGKSSLINALINRKNLAFTSKKPGFTKLLNYYNVDDTFYLVDAPGYGYAKTGKRTNEAFEVMMNNYFTDNTSLKMIYLLIDSRRELSVEDEEFLSFVLHLNLKVTIVFTKADKLNQSMRAKAKNMYKKLFSDQPFDVFFTSSVAKENIDKLQNHIVQSVKDNSLPII